MPPTHELVTIGAPAILRDGSRVRLRQGHHTDGDLLVRGFERLSNEGRYRRFLAATPELTPEMVSYLTEIDHHDHEAIVALEEETGEGIGVARYVRNLTQPDTAEVAVTVIDEWQGRGVGTLLLEVLGERARAEGIRGFTAMMLATNQQMMEVLAGLGPVHIVERDTGTVQIETPIPDTGLAPALKKLLQIAARDRAGLPPAE
jgi:GNAT superfamily N-acetyltransferase